MDIRDPRRFARDTFGEGVIVGEIGKAAEPRAAFALRGLVAVGPGCDIAGKCPQLATAGKIHVDAGAADDEIRCDDAARRLQFDALAGLARGSSGAPSCNVKLAWRAQRSYVGCGKPSRMSRMVRMKRQRQASSRSLRWRRKPRNVSQR